METNTVNCEARWLDNQFYSLPYTSFAELGATEVCLRLNQDIIIDPKLKQHLEVLFLFDPLPSQSESVYPCNFTSPFPRHLSSYSTVPLKYLSACFAATQFSCLGFTMNWVKLFTAKHILGLVLARYIKEPITCLYNVQSNISEYEVVTFILVIIGVPMVLQSFIRNLFRILIAYLPFPRKISLDLC